VIRQYASLRWKLTFLVILASTFAVCLAAAGFTWLDIQRFWGHTGAEVGAVGDIVADQVGPAITLGDHAGAKDVLASLRADAVIREAELYDGRGMLFATMRQEASTPRTRPADGIHRTDSGLIVAKPVMAGGERIGTLVLTAGIPGIGVILGQYLHGAAVILVLSMIVAACMAAILQSRVSAPILEIAHVAQRIARTHRFTDRVEIRAEDEVGKLASSFNAMLVEIERRDVDLEAHRRTLEQEILERNAVNAELLLAKEKAESAARLKSEFLANMSHEIRTPMNGVLGMTDLALATSLTREQSEYLQGAKTSAEALLRILDDILDVSKLEAGKMAIEAMDFDLRAMLQNTLRLFEIPARKNGLELLLSVEPDCPAWVRGDPVRLRQILVNLVGNAVKFTREGSIEVGVARASGDGLLFAVKDTGIGIARDKLDTIFEAFTQADGSHTRRFGGTGLGLTITRKLVGLMGGKVWVESEPGAGSRFYLELPLPEQGAPAPADQECNATAAPALLPLNVLVAEDNVVNQKVICSLLRLGGSVANLAANGAEAYRLFLDKPFDLVLMDVQMPEVDGLEATSMIRAEERRRNLRPIPIVALTAQTTPSEHEQCFAVGMDGIITKPVSRERLMRTIAEITGARK
jgi:signal transduction histidine kinase/CheY-like chemotaxis protein